MSQLHDVTKFENTTEVYIPYEMLSNTQRAYIDWKALGGIITDDTGPHKVTLDEIGQMLNPANPVLKQNICQSCKNVPNFWELVVERRKYFGSSSRLQYMHDKWYIAAAGMKNWSLTEAWLINHDDTYKAPKLKVEHEVGNEMADLVERMLQAEEKANRKIIDATVTQKTESNPGTSA